ncbi:MAG: hypothetical protein AAGF75_01915 [Cyanobacteria bacterium P01_H01_bin.130]
MNNLTRCSYRRSLAVLTAIALPMSAIGCVNNSEALLPLGAVCDGAGVPEAAAYDPQSAEPPTVAIAKENDILSVRNQFLGSGPKVAGEVAAAQLVLCVYPNAPTTYENCRYFGSGSATIKRQKQTADVKLVAAKTGQVLGGDTLSGVASDCPKTISVRQGSEPEDRVYEADGALTAAIAEWVPGAITRAQTKDIVTTDASEPAALTGDPIQDATPVTSIPPVTAEASADAGDITAQCDAFNEWHKTTMSSWVGAQLTAKNSTLDLAEDDIKVIVAVRVGIERLDEDISKLHDAIATLQEAPLAEPELLEFRNQFLTTLTAMKTNSQRFQTLVLAAEPHTKQTPVPRGKLEPIAQQMGPLSERITQQLDNLKDIRTESFRRCLQLKRN